MHELALRGITDQTAPPRVRGSVEIDLSPDAVFDALAEVSNRPSFRADVTDAHAEGPAASGQAFSWRANDAIVTSRFALVDRPARLTWIWRSGNFLR
ncbi:SRPBCC family protein [Agromyces silvae]|uniref:hypothetical protein n=1 Tax=Agromyces silvae TaxID=3388266 RepID=UPI00280A50D1|nr:hypothetical protein [Agromyces protaetiae]